VELVVPETVFRAAVDRVIRRDSGLRSRLTNA
jgi:hypothetical protein